MGKRSQHAIPRKPKRGRISGGQSIPDARSMKGDTPQRMMQLNQLEAIWESFPEGLIVRDRNQKIVRINAAARKLFEVATEAQCQGRDYPHFLKHYLCSDEQPSCVSAEHWLMSLALAGTTGAGVPENTPLLLHLPSGSKIAVTARTFSMGNQERGMKATISVFQEFTHGCQEVCRLQRAHEAMLELLSAIAQIPEQRDDILPEETFLLAPPVLFMAQQLVDIIRSVLDCRRVNILAFDQRTDYLYFVAGSGLTAEQERHWREMGGRFHLVDVLDDAARARLGANQEVMTAHDHLRTIEYLGKQALFPAYPHPAPPGSETFLFLPLFLEQQWFGVLAIVKASAEGEYTPEEIALMKAVTAQTMLVIEGIHCLSAQDEKQKKALIQREVHRLAGEFLNLAAHELRTPLTGVQGNLQLAQHRLQTLKDRLAPPSAQIHKSLASVERPVALASATAQLLQRMINDMIDDARVQTNTLTLSLQPEDLGTLLREVAASQQHTAPEHPIVLDVPPLEQGVPILADAGRITYVLTTYLTNALVSSPPERPVEVHLQVEDALAHVFVHNEGAGIAEGDLDHLWERFYRAKGDAVQHKLDLSCGLPLYLCRVFMERHEGSVGVQSAPGQGATFWFTVPITPSPRR